MKKIFLAICAFNCFILADFNLSAQNKLYPNEFPLRDVTLLKGPFKHARDLNIEVLLKYNVDRLLAPYRKEAGLPKKAKCYPNWAGLDGHVGGHYLSAMAMNYAATSNEECKRRMDYMLSELKVCQEANTINNADWGVGYVGGFPNSKKLWSAFKTGDFGIYNSSWAKEADVYINNEKQNIEITPNSYISLDRKWTNNDKIRLVFHYDFYIKTMPDDKNVIAFFYGPILLAFEDTSELILKGKIDDILSDFSVTDNNKIFQLNNNGRTYMLRPLYDIENQHYGVYATIRNY